MKKIKLQIHFNNELGRLVIEDAYTHTPIFEVAAGAPALVDPMQVGKFLCDHANYEVDDVGNVRREAYATTWLTRPDLTHEDVGLTEEQAQAVDDSTMAHIAEDMGEAHMNVYWIDLPIIAKEVAPEIFMDEGELAERKLWKAWEDASNAANRYLFDKSKSQEDPEYQVLCQKRDDAWNAWSNYGDDDRDELAPFQFASHFGAEISGQQFNTYAVAETEAQRLADKLHVPVEIYDSNGDFVETVPPSAQ